MVLIDLTKQVADIKERVTFNTQLLQEISRQQKRGIDKDKIKLPCELPLNSYESVLAVEQKLKSTEFYSQLVIFFVLRLFLFILWLITVCSRCCLTIITFIIGIGAAVLVRLSGFGIYS